MPEAMRKSLAGAVHDAPARGRPSAPAATPASTDEEKSNGEVPSAGMVGERVVSVSGKPMTGTVVFVGMTKFSEGTWVGINLDEPNGKNDGSVKGVRYFKCEANHGIFARPRMVVIEPSSKREQEEEVPSPAVSEPKDVVETDEHGHPVRRRRRSMVTLTEGELTQARNSLAVPAPLLQTGALSPPRLGALSAFAFRRRTDTGTTPEDASIMVETSDDEEGCENPEAMLVGLTQLLLGKQEKRFRKLEARVAKLESEPTGSDSVEPPGDEQAEVFDDSSVPTDMSKWAGQIRDSVRGLESRLRKHEAALTVLQKSVEAANAYAKGTVETFGERCGEVEAHVSQLCRCMYGDGERRESTSARGPASGAVVHDWLTATPDAAEMDRRVAEAERVAAQIHDLGRRVEVFLAAGGADGDRQQDFKSAVGPIPELSPMTAEGMALKQLLRHTVPVPNHWDYYLCVPRCEWEAAKASSAKKLVTYRYLAENMYYMKGCHDVEGRGSLEAVLHRATHPDHDVVLKVSIKALREMQIPVLGDRLMAPGQVLWENTLHPHVFAPLPVRAVVAWAPLKHTGGKVGVDGMRFPYTVDQDRWAAFTGA